MLLGVAPSESRPEPNFALSLQASYQQAVCSAEQSGLNDAVGNGNNTVHRLAGLTHTHHYRQSGDGENMLLTICSGEGVFSLHYTGHALAAANQAGKFYFFDPDRALFQFDTNRE